MNIAVEKDKIIKWINSLENPIVIEQINNIRKRESFSFDKEWEKAISLDSAREKTADFIKLFPWKK